jgi:glycosyltransferase involved in cell wall biosynthesis
MKVIHIVSTIHEEAAGPSYLVPSMCEALISLGLKVKLALLDWTPFKIYKPFIKKFPLGFGPRRLGLSPKMRKWLKHEINEGNVNIIHNHSLWMMPNVYAGDFISGSSCKLVVSPHGTLSKMALSINSLQKKVFWYLFQAQTIKAVHCFHATAESEYHDIRSLGFKQPVCIIPNGVNVPPLNFLPKRGPRKLLYLGRIHPIKGIDILVNAWKIIEREFPDWELCIAGPDNNGYLLETQNLAKKLKIKRVKFLGPLFGEKKLRAYREASIFILPSHSENFGMTIAESLAAGTPVITTKAAPWEKLEEKGAGWWIDIGVDPLVICLRHALAKSSVHLEKMGRAGWQWMLEDFSWEHITKKMLRTYRWLLIGGKTPSWVKLD